MLLKFFKRYTFKGVLFKFKEYTLRFLSILGVYSFSISKKEWEKLPFDDIGYIDASDVLNYSKSNLIAFIQKFEDTRYNENNWRNYKNLWRESLGLDKTKNKIIFDYGCGFGIESLQFAKNENKLILGDINLKSIDVASKILETYNFYPIEKVQIRNQYPFYELNHKIDILYSNGVLHHTPNIKEILIYSLKFLKNNGEIRLLLYSDKMWTAITNAPVPKKNFNIRRHNKYWSFVRGADLVGQYANFYSEEKLKYIIGNDFRIDNYQYICGPREFKENGNNLENCYCTVIIKPS